MQYYELLYIIPATENVEVVKTRVEGILNTRAMEVLRHEEAGRFKLAYSMNHVRQGVYYLAAFRGEPGTLPAIEAALRLEEGVLRTMVCRSSEAALARRVNLAAFEQPVIDRGERRRMPVRHPFRRFAPAVAGVVPAVSAAGGEVAVAARASSSKPLSEAEINEKIDKILEEKVL